MAHTEEAGATPALGLEGVHGEGLVAAPARMHDVILTAAQGPFHPLVQQIKRQGRMNADGRRGAVADTSSDFHIWLQDAPAALRPAMIPPLDSACELRLDLAELARQNGELIRLGELLVETVSQLGRAVAT